MTPLVRELLVTPLLSQKKRFGVMVPALVAMAFGDGLFLTLMGGFTKALFGDPTKTVRIAELLPSAVAKLFPVWGEREVDHWWLAGAVPAAIFLAGLLKTSATYFYQVNQQALALFMAKSYRERLFAAVVSLPYVEIKKRSAGEWMSLVMNDVMVLQNRFSDIMQVLVRHSFGITFGFVWLAIIHWRTAVVMLLLSPIIAFGMGRTGKRIARYAEAFQRELTRIAGSVLDLRARFDFIRAQGAEAFERRRFRAKNFAYYRMILKSIFVRSAFAPALELLGFSLFAVVVFLVGRGLLGDFTPEMMLRFFAALGLMLKPLKEVGEQLARYHETKGTLAQSLGTFQRLRELASLGKRPLTADAGLSGPAGLRVRKIRAGMAGETRFAAENLALEPGRAVAVIGPSGAGKSTLLKTLAGLVEPLEWDADLSWGEATGRMSMVSQDPFLFDDSLETNLTYGLSKARMPSDDELWNALESVNIGAEVRSWPEGLKTRLFAVGSNVSGGQLQRLVIARGLLRQKPMWLLDEATSAVDPASEKDITQRLIAACRQTGRALLAVTHRLTWLDQFDEVWFVEEGRVALSGPHAKLMQEPRYRDYCLAHQAEGAR